MAQRFAWVLNLDAEYELDRNAPGYNPSAALLEQLERYGQGSRALLSAADLLLSAEQRLEPAEAGAYLGRAWCPTPRALARLKAAGVRAEPHPSAEILRHVNHRRFACDLGGGLPGQRYLERREELDPVIESGARPLLLKRPLAFAGRGQLRVYARPSEKDWSWIDASFRNDGLVLEPLVAPEREFSLHGFVWPDGRREVGRACVQEVSERGVFRGIRVAEPQELDGAEREALVERAEAVAGALHAAGYFGPFGIDAYRYLEGDRAGFCALSEINARYSMGFAVGFPRHPSSLSLE